MKERVGDSDCQVSFTKLFLTFTILYNSLDSFLSLGFPQGGQFPPVRTSEQVLELRSKDPFMSKLC